MTDGAAANDADSTASIAELVVADDGTGVSALSAGEVVTVVFLVRGRRTGADLVVGDVSAAARFEVLDFMCAFLSKIGTMS